MSEKFGVDEQTVGPNPCSTPKFDPVCTGIPLSFLFWFFYLF